MLRVQVPRKLRWPQGSHQDPRSPGAPAPPIIHPQALKGGAWLSLQFTLLYGPELGGHHARPASSVEAVTYERTQCEAHSLMAVTGLGEPRRVSLRRLQLGGHVAHCEARGLFFELLEKKKKAYLFFLLPNMLGSSMLPFGWLLTMIMPLSLNFPYWVYLKFTLTFLSFTHMAPFLNTHQLGMR